MRPTSNWRLGLFLALSAAVLWATLPVALEVSLQRLDPYTLTWYRFLTAFGVLGAWLAATRQFGAYRSLSRRGVVLLAVASVMLPANYILFLLGLQHTAPGTSQVVIQTAPMFMALGAMWFFGERYSRAQWLGFTTVAAGLGLFFARHLSGATISNEYLLGIALILAGAITWAAYALAQKRLLDQIRAPLVLWCIYAWAVLFFAPFAHPRELLHLHGPHLWAFAYCALNTLGAYGAFSESLRHWEASRVSAVLALVPLLTLLCVQATAVLLPELVPPEPLTLTGWLGGIVVVAGSMLTSLAGRPGRVVHAITAGEKPRVNPPR